MGHSQKPLESARKQKQRELSKLLSCDKKLDNLFNRMYEDNISGKIDDERFARMPKSYSEEQAIIAAKVKALQSELEYRRYLRRIFKGGAQVHKGKEAHAVYVQRVD